MACLSLRSLDELKNESIHEIALAIGIFDGVHLGHRKLLSVLTEHASACSLAPVVMTFDPHPRFVLNPLDAPALLLSLSERRARLAESGVAAVVSMPFTASFAALPPQTFLDTFLHGHGVNVRALCVGQRFRFGADGLGDAMLLSDYCASKGISFDAVPELRINGETVSSTAIRTAIRHGDIEKANHFLGRPASLEGVVVRGVGVASAELGFPTANLHPDAGVVPACGVYAARVFGSSPLSGSEPRRALVAVGVAPTFGGHGGLEAARIEVHIPAFSGDLYDARLRLELLARIRSERKFSSVSALKQQIYNDLRSLNLLMGEQTT